ncbi:MAG TPA: serine/threonine-protein kinase [Pyrinomonadaceae bacterium]|nr:serine/threonine-protein kinase [Pyrinomonadaceae bacterium]
METLDGKYQIEQLLGEGGMGAVYRATHLGTKRTVAVKVIHPQLSAHDQFVGRFRREAGAAGRLRHPNVVDVTDFGFAQTTNGPVAYLVMEYLDGCTLAEIVAEEGALPIQWVVDILEQVCAAVEVAHRAGIIHRDLKPDNIWLEPNGRGGYTVKVLDFGLVKLGKVEPSTDYTDSPIEAETLIQSDERATLILTKTTTAPAVDEALTVVGSVMGTPFYMSPEQCRGERLDTRSDIYSLGVVAYRLLSGETPFQGSPEEVIELHKTAVAPHVHERNSKVPRKMAHIVMSALAKDPAERPQSAAGFASAIRASWEGPGHLLRQALALYSEHFPTFFKIALLGYAPFTVLALVNLLDLFIDEQSQPTQLMWFGAAVFLSMVVSLLFAYFFVTAVTVPVVVQLMIAPLRQIRIGAAVAALKRRWPVFAITSLIVMILILFGSLIFIIPGLLAAVIYALYAPVVIMEQHGVRGTLRRSRTLSRRAFGTALAITIVQFALPVLVWRAAVHTNFTLKLNDDFSPKQIGFDFSMSARSALYQLLGVFVTPLTAIMASLLYLKTRKAGGESLRDASDQFEALDIPRSKWQARMRSRLKASTDYTDSV